MNLYICAKKEEHMTDGLYLPVLALKVHSTHLVLAASKWEEMYIELTEDIPENCLKYLRDRVGVINVKLPEKVTTHVLKLLIELYPEYEGKLRKAYMKGEDLSEVLHQVR